MGSSGSADVSVKCPHCGGHVGFPIMISVNGGAVKMGRGYGARSDASIVYGAFWRWMLRHGDSDVTHSDLMHMTGLPTQRVQAVIKKWTADERILARHEWGGRGRMRSIYTVKDGFFDSDPDGKFVKPPKKSESVDPIDAAFAEVDSTEKDPNADLPDWIRGEIAKQNQELSKAPPVDSVKRQRMVEEKLKLADENDPLLKPTE
jgi:hypothetical protein